MKKFWLKVLFGGLGLGLLGALANEFTIILNNGRMPVVDTDCPAGIVLNPTHICATAHDAFPWLIDRISYGTIIMSLGDVAILVGFTVFAFGTLFLTYEVIKSHL